VRAEPELRVVDAFFPDSDLSDFVDKFALRVAVPVLRPVVFELLLLSDWLEREVDEPLPRVELDTVALLLFVLDPLPFRDEVLLLLAEVGINCPRTTWF
jgi:hypothetical protein